MAAPEQRFCCRKEDAGTWMVWDKVSDRPARLGGCVLRGREEFRARAACAILTRIYRNRLDFASVAQTRRSRELVR